MLFVFALLHSRIYILNPRLVENRPIEGRKAGNWKPPKAKKTFPDHPSGRVRVCLWQDTMAPAADEDKLDKPVAVSAADANLRTAPGDKPTTRPEIPPNDASGRTIGPAMPPKRVIGPAAPPTKSTIGPQLPPTSERKRGPIGPSLPAEKKAKRVIGPATGPSAAHSSSLADKVRAQDLPCGAGREFLFLSCSPCMCCISAVAKQNIVLSAAREISSQLDEL